MSVLYNKFYDVSRLVIWGESNNKEDGDRRPRLTFGFRDGNPRITVNTGQSGIEGMINFPCDPLTMTAAMELLKDVVEGEADNKIIIDSLGTNYVNNQPTSEKRLVSTLYAGKSKDGIIYFSLMTEGRPMLVFPLKPSPWHVFKDKTKSVIPDSVISKKLAIGLIDQVKNIISHILVNYTAEEYQHSGRKQGEIKKRGNDSDSNAKKASTSVAPPKDIVSDIDDLLI